MAEAPDSPIPVTPLMPDTRVHNGETTSSPTATIPASAPVTSSTASAPVTPVTELFFASIHPGPDRPLPESCRDFARGVLAYEKLVGCPVWVLLQDESSNDDKDS